MELFTFPVIFIANQNFMAAVGIFLEAFGIKNSNVTSDCQLKEIPLKKDMLYNKRK
jgi:hypothetical protein